MTPTPLARVVSLGLCLLSIWCAATRPAAAAAAGSAGDYYDNRDGGHSPMRTKSYPLLQKITYTDEEIARRRHWGSQRVIVPHVTFGNSSTASPAASGGAHTRRYYNSAHGLRFLFKQYTQNNLYVYPEHRDHDPGHNGSGGYGDLFPANSPYIMTSQGSSGTDQPFLHAIATTLASFRPDVKKRLVETGMLMPTVQMIFRISNKNAPGRKNYMTGAAHPTVFVGANVDKLAMARMAADMRLNNIPPMISLKVVSEDEPMPGRDFFDAGRTEKLADTPCVIARVVRGRNYLRKIVVSAEGSTDLNKRPLKYRWAVLRGDAKRIKIKLLNKAGSVAELTVPYHRRRPISKGSKMESNRVDIGVFVHNGTYFSAPGFVTFFSLDSEERTYDKDGRVLEIAYGAGSTTFRVADWDSVIKKLTTKPTNWTDRTLRKGVEPAEVRVLANLSRYTAKAAAAVKTTKKRYDALKVQYKKAAAAKTKARKARDAAVKAYKAKPTSTTKRKLTSTTYSLKMASVNESKIRKRQWNARKSLKRAQKAESNVLDERVSSRTDTPRAIIMGAFDKIIQDPEFVTRNRKAIKAAFGAATAPQKAAVVKVQKRLVSLGIISDAAGFAFEVRPERKGTKPLRQRMSRFERGALERLNKIVLANLLYPTLVKAAYSKNYVERGFTHPRWWRDVYRYNEAGVMTGWTRIGGGRRTEFNADGLIALARDASGRCTRAQTVRYRFGPPKKGSRTPPPLIHAPGGEIVHYEYADKDDCKGRIVKREPAPRQ